MLVSENMQKLVECALHILSHDVIFVKFLKICLEPADEIWLPEFLVKADGHSTVLGCKTYDCVGILVPSEGNIDMMKYTKILNANLNRLPSKNLNRLPSNISCVIRWP